MKHIFMHKCAAMLCAGAMLSGTALTVSAADSADTVLPSGKTVAEVQAQIEEYIAAQTQHEEPNNFASAGFAVFDADGILYENYAGLINFKDKTPADADTVYEWGSISKTMIWVSVMQLWEQGKIDLDRDVREYLPDGFFQYLKYDEPITMMQLMNHTAGWQETTVPIFTKDENNVPSLKDALQSCEPIQVHRPGEVCAYSNYGAAVAGYVVECITGTDYCDYVHAHILDPLGMTHTSVNPAHTDNAWVQAQRKNEHSYQFMSLVMNDSVTVDKGTVLEYITPYPAGSATGTIRDLVTYTQAFLDDDAPLFQNKETQTELFKETHFYGDSDIPTCCHGFWCDEMGVRLYGHTGATYFGSAVMWFDPVSKIGYVAACNQYEGNWFLEEPLEMVFGTFTPDKYGTGTEKDAADIEGHILPARAIWKGMLHFTSLVTGGTMEAREGSKITDLGNGVWQLSDGEYTQLIGVRQSADGTRWLEVPSSDIAYDGSYLPRLLMFTVYFLAAVGAFYLLRIRLKLKRSGRWVGYRSAAVIGWGFAAQLLSTVLVLAMFMAYYAYVGGVPKALSTAIGLVQMLCLIACAAAAVFAVIAAASKKKEKAPRVWYWFCAAGNTLTATAIIAFSLCRFS